ncbi:MAG: heme exporter protein CcmB [Alphaproteobacteria bacterium]|nr:heme exporter protein CcmB [Alphaproteobacteria bacterium]
MSAFLALVGRDLALRGARGGLLLPLIFFALVAILFPFAVGPDPALLARIAGGVMWVAALLAALLPVDTLLEPDRADGTLDQFVARGTPLALVVVARTVSHWLGFAPLLLLTTLVASALLNLPAEQLPALVAGLAIGTPALAALGVLAAALTAGLRGAGGLAGLLVLPLALPVLIFGAGVLTAGPGETTAVKLLAAASLFLVAIAPIGAAAALRAALD